VIPVKFAGILGLGLLPYGAGRILVLIVMPVAKVTGTHFVFVVFARFHDEQENKACDEKADAENEQHIVPDRFTCVICKTFGIRYLRAKH
jgi:hypothetical protein